MKIAVIRQKYVNYGGAENFSAEFALQLARAGHEVHIFANRWQSPEAPNIHFHKVPAIRFNSFLRALSFAWCAERALRRERWDVVQSHERTWRQDIYRAGDGCHKEWLERRLRYLPGWRRWLVALSPFHRLMLGIERALFTPGRYKKIVAISDRVKRDIRKHYGVPEEDIAVIYNGVRLDRFHPRNRLERGLEVRRKLAVADGTVLFLYVGSGFERKGLKFLIQSLDYLERDDWRLLVIGKGNRNRYRRFASPGTVDKILFLEPVADIENYYAAADAFVLPSIYEPFGNANLEALASGLPVITSRFSGAADIIRHEVQGLIVEEPGDSREIGRHMNSLFDAGVREKMGRQARSLAERFTWERHTQDMIRLYEEILNSG